PLNRSPGTIRCTASPCCWSATACSTTAAVSILTAELLSSSLIFRILTPLPLVLPMRHGGSKPGHYDRFHAAPPDGPMFVQTTKPPNTCQGIQRNHVY